MTQSLETIERRINALGLTEPTIQLHGRKDNEILVQLPGEGDPTRAKAVIQAGGQLELQLVEDPTTYSSQVCSAGRARRRFATEYGTRAGANEARNAPGRARRQRSLVSAEPRAGGDRARPAQRDGKSQHQQSRPM